MKSRWIYALIASAALLAACSDGESTSSSSDGGDTAPGMSTQAQGGYDSNNLAAEVNARGAAAAGDGTKTEVAGD